MSSERAVAVPRTAVVMGIADPVEEARAELKAALFAIEDKVNVPKQAQKAQVRARLFARAEPVKTIAVVVGAALVVGGLVWAGVRSFTAAR